MKIGVNTLLEFKHILGEWFQIHQLPCDATFAGDQRYSSATPSTLRTPSFRFGLDTAAIRDISIQF